MVTAHFMQWIIVLLSLQYCAPFFASKFGNGPPMRRYHGPTTRPPPPPPPPPKSTKKPDSPPGRPKGSIAKDDAPDDTPIGQGPPGGPQNTPARKIKKYCYGRYMYGDPFENKVVQSDCAYYECKNGIYTQRPCPEGIGTIGTLKAAWALGRRGINTYPCVKVKTACKPSLKKGEKGFNNTKVTICGIDLIWAIDISCSITLTNKVKMKRFIQRAVAQVPIRGNSYSRVGVLSFSEKIYHVAYLNEFKRQSQLITEIRKMRMEPAKCGTVTYRALQVAREEYLSDQHGRRRKRKAVLIVLSDGFTYPVGKKPETFKQAAELKKAKIETYVIGLPNKMQIKLGVGDAMAGKDEWDAIATEKENVYTLSSFDALTTIIGDIIRDACFTLS